MEDSSHSVDSKRIVIDGDTMDVVDLTSKKKKKKVRSIPLELQRLFSQLQLLDELSVGTELGLSVGTGTKLELSVGNKLGLSVRTGTKLGLSVGTVEFKVTKKFCLKVT